MLIYSVNDGAVMEAWARSQHVQGSMVTMAGDVTGAFTQKLGLVLDDPGVMQVLGSPRCKRFSMLVDDGIIKSLNVAAAEDDPAGDAAPEVSMVDKMLEDLKAFQAAE